MNIKPIKSEADYDAALSAIDGLMGTAPDTPEGDELEVLVTLVEAYEAAHWPIEAPDPIAAIEHGHPPVEVGDQVSGPRRSTAVPATRGRTQSVLQNGIANHFDSAIPFRNA